MSDEELITELYRSRSNVKMRSSIVIIMIAVTMINRINFSVRGFSMNSLPSFRNSLLSFGGQARNQLNLERFSHYNKVLCSKVSESIEHVESKKPKASVKESSSSKSKSDAEKGWITKRSKLPKLWDSSDEENRDKCFKIVSWNVAGLRAILRKDPTSLSDLAKKHLYPDVICLQETKLQYMHLEDEKLGLKDVLVEEGKSCFMCKMNTIWFTNKVFSTLYRV